MIKSSQIAVESTVKNIPLNEIEFVKTEKEAETRFEDVLTDSGIPWCQTEKKIEKKLEINIPRKGNSRFAPEELEREKQAYVETHRRLKKMLEFEFIAEKSGEFSN